MHKYIASPKTLKTWILNFPQAENRYKAVLHHRKGVMFANTMIFFQADVKVTCEKSKNIFEKL